MVTVPADVTPSGTLIEYCNDTGYNLKCYYLEIKNFKEYNDRFTCICQLVYGQSVIATLTASNNYWLECLNQERINKKLAFALEDGIHKMKQLSGGIWNVFSLPKYALLEKTSALHHTTETGVSSGFIWMLYDVSCWS